MKRATALCLALPLLLCLTPTTARARQTIHPFVNVPMTDQAYNDFYQISGAGVFLSFYPYTTLGSRVPMSGYDFAVNIIRLWQFNPQPHTTSVGAAALRHDQEVCLQNHPLALAALKRLVNEFQPELKGLGQDVPAMQAYLVALRPNLPPLPVSPPFPDVPRDHWAYQSVETLRKLGIIMGETHNQYHGE